jgi:hypothetical protein
MAVKLSVPKTRLVRWKLEHRESKWHALSKDQTYAGTRRVVMSVCDAIALESGVNSQAPIEGVVEFADTDSPEVHAKSLCKHCFGAIIVAEDV